MCEFYESEQLWWKAVLYSGFSDGKCAITKLSSCLHCDDSPGSSRSKTTNSVRINVDKMYLIADIMSDSPGGVYGASE